MNTESQRTTQVLAEDRQRLEGLVAANIQQGRLDEAEAALRALLKAWPGMPAYWLELAALLERKGDRTQAATVYSDLVERQPDLAVARFNFACFLRRGGRFEEAMRQHQRALDLKIEQPEEVLSNMAVISGELGKHADARNYLQRALTLNPTYIPALYNLGLLHEEYGDRAGSLALFERILQLDPGYYNAMVRIAHARTLSDPGDPVVKRLRRALRRTQLDPLTRESLHFALGKVLDDCGQYDEAFEQFEAGNRQSATRLFPYSPRAAEQQTTAVIETFTADWLKRVTPVSDRPLVFITGMFRSGSTLFEQVLAAHPQVTPGGEINFFGHLLARSLAPRAPAEGAEATAPAGAPLTFPAAFAQPDPEAWQKLGTGYVDYLDRRFPSGTTVTNKRPDAFALLGLLRGLFPNARFVNTVRDPLDTCLSIYVHQFDNLFGYTGDLGHIAHYFTQYQRLLAHWKQLFPESILDASYDEYVKEREPVTRSLLQFLGLEWNEACLEPHLSGKRVRTESLWQVRERVYRKASGRWRHYERHIEPLRRYFP